MHKEFLTFGGRATLVALLALQAPAVAHADGPLPAISAVNTTDLLADLRGGLKRQGRTLDKADVTVTYLGDDHGLPGLSAFIDVQATDATNFSGAIVGAVQSVSSLDAPAGLRLADAWIAKDFGGQGGFKAGVIDLNTEFDVQPTAALFLNSAFGIGPDFSQSGQNGPSIFPSTGLGLVGWWLPGGHWTLKTGLFEGVPGDPAHLGRTSFSLGGDEGALVVLEARNHLTPDFVLGMGAWRYTAGFDAIDPALGRISGNSGYYAIADGLLDSVSADESLSGWVRLGFADGRINALDATLGAGLVYSGLFGRKADQAGISIAQARFGVPARRAALAGGDAIDAAETVIEATYSAVLNAHLTVQPDLQYVIHPGGAPDTSAAMVAGSRLIASW